ncbi:DMT family transporter [Altererythrobacter sp. MF3-039]|uniref:DMT family transporter n=1 Tax=Altererythrobacter sp. MF3-039 TaxID=3252901 RepID=UPI00390C73B0
MQHSERSGQLYAVAGFAVLSAGDAVVKTMAGEWPPVAVAALRFSIGAVLLAVLVAWREGLGRLWPGRPALQFFRGFCLASASLLFFSAVYLMPLAEAISLAFLTPIFTALLSGPLLGERVRPVVWGASGMAMVGVMIVLRPNLENFGLVAMFPIGAALFFSLMVIANRASAKRGSAISMQFYMNAVAAPLLIAAAFLFDWTDFSVVDPLVPDWSVIARCALVAVTASTAHLLIFLGTTRAGASSVAPMTYVQIIVTLFFGWWWFDHIPDALTFLGVAIIITSGLFLWHRMELNRPSQLN